MSQLTAVCIGITPSTPLIIPPFFYGGDYSPPPLTTTISPEDSNRQRTVTLSGSGSGIARAILTMKLVTAIGSIVPAPGTAGEGIDVGLIKRETGALDYYIRLRKPPQLNPTEYVPGDKYESDACGVGYSFKFTRNPAKSIAISFSGSNITYNTSLTNSNQLSFHSQLVANSCGTIDNCGNIRVPIATLVGQTTVDGSDIGYVIFTVCDEFTYYDSNTVIPDNICAINYITPEQIQQTVFNECCPFIVSVLKGKGSTLLEKAESIYVKISKCIDITFNEFYDNILLYGMAKYLIARLLYGKFNIKFEIFIITEAF